MSSGSTEKPVEPVTSQDVIQVAQRVTNDPEVKILDYKINPYSKEKLGFLGTHQQLLITVQKKNLSNPETLQLFVKSIPYDSPEQTDYIISDGVFEKESKFFDTIIPRLTEHYKYDKWAPKCYLAKNDVLVLEDLRNEGYKLVNRFCNDTNLLKSSLRSLARFHACSIIADNHLRHTLKEPVSLNECYKKYFKEQLFTREVTGPYRFCKKCINFAIAASKRLGHDVEKIQKGFDKLFELVKPNKKYCNVVGHGDLWTNNIMFDDTKPIPKCVFVDFQVIRFAPLVLDILHLVHLNSTREFRKTSEKELMKYYHSELENTVKSGNTTNDVKIPTLDEILKALDDLRIFGAGVASLYFQVILLDPAVLTESTKDAESYENFVFGDQTQETLDYMDKDENFRIPIEEALNEFAELCDKL